MQKMYEYARGDDFYCKIYITKDDRLLFLETKYPKGTSDEIKRLFLEDAERAILTLIEKESEVVYNDYKYYTGE